MHLFVSVGIMLTKLRGRIATNMGVTFFDRFRLILIQTASKRFRPLPPPQLKDTIVKKFCQYSFFHKPLILRIYGLSYTVYMNAQDNSKTILKNRRNFQMTMTSLKYHFKIIQKSVVRPKFRLPKSFKYFENLLNYG